MPGTRTVKRGDSLRSTRVHEIGVTFQCAKGGRKVK